MCVCVYIYKIITRLSGRRKPRGLVGRQAHGLLRKAAVPAGSERLGNCCSENKYLFALALQSSVDLGKIRYGVS